jgi:curli biogenesis system outer membrane secretion channel CsgG
MHKNGTTAIAYIKEGISSLATLKGNLLGLNTQTKKINGSVRIVDVNEKNVACSQSIHHQSQLANNNFGHINYLSDSSFE